MTLLAGDLEGLGDPDRLVSRLRLDAEERLGCGAMPVLESQLGVGVEQAPRLLGFRLGRVQSCARRKERGIDLLGAPQCLAQGERTLCVGHTRKNRE